MNSLDKFDLAILGELQANARLTNAELAQRVGLSAAPCWRRVRALEESGFIKGYRAEIDRYKIGLGVLAFVRLDAERSTGGLTLAISCDMIVASRSATFGYPEIDAGVLPSIHFTHLPRVIGRHRAFELLFTGRTFDAQEAYTLGLVTRLTAEGTELEEARRLAKTLAGKSTQAIRVGREAFMHANDNGYRQAVLAAADSFYRIAGSDSGREGIAAFVEKRKPSWRS